MVMMLNALLAVLFLFVQTPQAGLPSDPSALTELAAEYCATEVAQATYTNVEIVEVEDVGLPPVVTYAAFDFETAEQAIAALEEAPLLVVQAYTEDPAVELEDYDDFAAEAPTPDYGDADIAHVITLPVLEDEDDVLVIELLGIVQESQLLLVLMFSDSVAYPAAPGVALETLLPFGEELDETWDGTGDLQDAIPEEDEMPLNWVRDDVTVEAPPNCE
ncbi:MAG TPA: hypothetical protein VGR22_02375 [Thermomicrobiales bacterium]|nr:hypothetical protein [Thermomicrobiales bacterium]